MNRSATDLLLHDGPSLPRGLAAALTGLRWLLAAFFVLLAVKNLAGDETMARDFARWGFPDWFRVATAVAQAVGALLLLDGRVAFWGALVLAGVLVGAAVTHLLHDPPTAVVSPLVVLVPTVLVGWALRPPLLSFVGAAR
jgi:uncharacterized membrane protein YphA (DoxX/SURF4 family)